MAYLPETISNTLFISHSEWAYNLYMFSSVRIICLVFACYVLQLIELVIEVSYHVESCSVSKVR